MQRLHAPRGRSAHGRAARSTERLKRELDVICRMGLRAATFSSSPTSSAGRASNGVPVGPGRGSGAGSLVAYCAWHHRTSIRSRYDLLFERFLNPERVSMPDFDIDFCMDGRDRVIEYVAQTLRPRARLADRHLRHHGREGRGARRRPRARHDLRLRRPDRASSFPSSSASRSTTRSEKEPELEALYKTEEEIGELIDLARVARRPRRATPARMPAAS